MVVDIHKAESFEIGKLVFAVAMGPNGSGDVKLLEREREVIEVDGELRGEFENRDDREGIAERAWKIIPQVLIFFKKCVPRSSYLR